jgi:ribonuclease HI
VTSAFYAVAAGKTVGIFSTWAECEESVRGFRGAAYKKFRTRAEAEAFIAEHKPVPAVTTGPAPPIPKSVTEEPDYYVYTDGACSNNGQEGAKAGIGIWFGPEDPRNISRPIEGKQTNNAAELTAILDTCAVIAADLESGKRVAIVSDSEYAIRCLTSYGAKCAEAGWTKDIPNKDLVRACYERYEGVGEVQFMHVAAHTDGTDRHSVGNAGADLLANRAIGLEGCPYSGGGAAPPPLVAARDAVYLNVPFAKKDEAKALGARWDADKRKWYVREGAAGFEDLVDKFRI